MLFAQNSPQPKVDFDAIKAAAAPHHLDLLHRWLPDGRLRGREWVARNPHRVDQSLGSFSVNVSTGRWADFATKDRGGDIISLGAFLFGLTQSEAARRIANMLGINANVQPSGGRR